MLINLSAKETALMLELPLQRHLRGMDLKMVHYIRQKPVNTLSSVAVALRMLRNKASRKIT